jgi:hypothetical protein
MSKTMQQLAQEAIDVQDACNLSGVAHGLSRAVTALWDLSGQKGVHFGPVMSVQEINQHPIVKMWVSKLHDLARLGFSDAVEYAEAYEKCRELAASCNCGDAACAATPGHCGAYTP